MSNRHTFVRLSFAAVFAIVGLSISMLSYAQEAEHPAAPAGAGKLTIEQKTSFDDNKTLGKWTLLKPGHEEQKGMTESAVIENAPSGSYTLIITPPEGATTSIRTYHGTEQVAYIQRPQVTIKLLEGEDLRIVINYTLTKTGLVSVQSEPAGIEFVMEGPNGIFEKSATPASYEHMPIGQYQVRYSPPESCGKMLVKSAQLTENGRASFDMKVHCAELEEKQKKEIVQDDKYVVIEVGGGSVLLDDVLQDTWFATYIYNAAKHDILEGYKDSRGKPTGKFGPSNNVTVAELAKIAHRLGGVSEESFAGINPTNTGALGVWFTPFISSAENRGWTIYRSGTVDPLRPATRAEVVVTFMQVLDVPLKWQKGQLFTDVSLRTDYASAIETAATDGIVDGRTDENGKPLHLFSPNDSINRAEIAKIINKILEVYKGLGENEGED